jgi:hypothetical protein
VGGYFDVTLPNLGVGTTGLTFTITPQPLPANMTFNRQSGELVFAPAPGQAGVSNFSVAVSNGSRSGTIVLPVTITDPVLPSTEVSGQVVDENGKPLAGMPVAIGDATAVTNASGEFTVAGVPADPGPISAGGSVGAAQGRQNLTAPVAQLLGHAVYTGANNVMPTPFILPTINWSTATSYDQNSSTNSLAITNAAMPGFAIQMPANAPGSAPAVGSVQVAELSPAVSAQHMPQGLSTGMLLLKVAGSAAIQPVQMTLPNSSGFQPGAVLSLYMMNYGYRRPRCGRADGRFG